MSAFIEITLISLALAFVLSLLYRFLTKPGEMRRIKKEMKFYQDKSKEAQKAGDTAKANEYMKDMMKASQQQFKQNMKPMMASCMEISIFCPLPVCSRAYRAAQMASAMETPAASSPIPMALHPGFPACSCASNCHPDMAKIV